MKQDTKQEQLAIRLKPIVSYPQTAQVGERYLFTIDVQLDEGSPWPYPEEEFEISFILETAPFFTHEPVGEHEPGLVLHRYGGTYGAAEYLLTASPKMIAPGKIKVTLLNGWGLPIAQIELACEVKQDAQPEARRTKRNIKQVQRPSLLSELSKEYSENPFLSAASRDIVDDANFIGREYNIQHIEDRVVLSKRQRASIAIIGLPDVGKHSLINKTLLAPKAQLHQQKLLPIKIDLTTYTDSGKPDKFFRDLISLCKYELEDEDLQLTASQMTSIAQTTQMVLKEWDASEGRRTISPLKGFFKHVLKMGLQVIFILDNFDHADSLFKEHISRIKWLRDLAGSECRITWIALACKPIREIKRLPKSISDDFFQEHRLGMFTQEDLETYFHALDQMGVSLSEEHKQMITAYCGRHPYFLTLLGYHLVEDYAHFSGKIDVEHTFYKVEERFNQSYERILNLVLDNDHRAQKLLLMLFDPKSHIEQKDIDRMLAYDLIYPNPAWSPAVDNIQPAYMAFSEHFQNYLQAYISKSLEDVIYESSVPQLTLRLPKDMESYSPDSTNRRFEVQVVIENKAGCSPADAIELIIQEDSEIFTVEMAEIKLEGSLRGGDQCIKSMLIQVTELALKSRAFTFPIYAQYRTRSGETLQTQEVAFAINLYAENQFERIQNPYATYANSHIVRDEHMFYGRSELIRNIAETIGNAQEQRKGIVIFGQPRSGKSSILYHLKLYLQQQYNNLLVVDLESVGAYLDEESKVSLFYQLLGGILYQLQDAIRDEEEKGKRGPLDLAIPDTIQFYTHPVPLRYFQEVLKNFKRIAAKTEGWQGIHIVLLLDEFSYLYGLIMRGRISEDFMKNWKAIIQVDLFSVVLAGQDVMPKFKGHFPNEFAAIKDQRISYLEPDEARKLIDEPICIGGKLGKSRYREKAIDRIVDLTAASPFYIQIFCDRLVEYMNRRRINLVTQADVEQVKNELIVGANALDEGNFDNLISSGDTSPDAIPEEEARAVLKVIAINSRTSPCRRDRIIVNVQTDIDKILQDLVAREVIEVEGHYYAIRVGLFKEWLCAR